MSQQNYWYDIDFTCGKYSISHLLKVRNNITGKELKPFDVKNKYYTLFMRGKQKYFNAVKYARSKGIYRPKERKKILEGNVIEAIRLLAETGKYSRRDIEEMFKVNMEQLSKCCYRHKIHFGRHGKN